MYEDLRWSYKETIDRIVAKNEGKLSIIGSGGGIGITGLLTVPGASAAIEQIHLPYSKQAWADYLFDTDWDPDRSFVSREFLADVETCWWRVVGEVNRLFFTAAIGTNRERKGSNRVIAMRNGVFHELQLPTVEFRDDFEYQHSVRLTQDMHVTRWLLTLI